MRRPRPGQACPTTKTKQHENCSPAAVLRSLLTMPNCAHANTNRLTCAEVTQVFPRPLSARGPGRHSPLYLANVWQLVFSGPLSMTNHTGFHCDWNFLCRLHFSWFKVQKTRLNVAVIVDLVNLEDVQFVSTEPHCQFQYLFWALQVHSLSTLNLVPLALNTPKWFPAHEH